LPVRGPGLRIETVQREPLVVAMSEDNPLSRRNKIPISALRGERFIIFPRPLHPWLYDLLIGLCVEAGFSPNIAHEQSEIYTSLALVSAENAVCLTGRSVRDVPAKGIVVRDVGPPVRQLELGVIYRRKDHSPVVARFLDVGRELAGRGSW
jgi:DNA-binding transcriptional LysR family regulator